MSDLTLPGTIPRLLRRCSPVIKDGWTGGAVVAKVRDLSVVVVSEDGPSWPFAQPASLRLDLTDATGRDHAAKWLARHVSTDGEPIAAWMVRPMLGDQWGLRVATDRCPAGRTWTLDYKISDLDCSDDRRLPDGSRWVDAEALRRVVLHVANGYPEPKVRA